MPPITDIKEFFTRIKHNKSPTITKQTPSINVVTGKQGLQVNGQHCVQTTVVSGKSNLPANNTSVNNNAASMLNSKILTRNNNLR